MSNDTPTPISDDEVVALTKAAFTQSRQDITQRGVGDTPSAPRDVQQQQPGITIDLGHKSIARLPDEVIDVIRAEIERWVPSATHPPRQHENTTHTDDPGSPSRTTCSRRCPAAS
jgi:hypothetical protein